MNYEIKKLKNNLNSLLINTPGSTSSTVQIWFKAGSALEQKSNQGIAHFLEHMFFKGTQKRPGSKIAHAVESFGGEINAFTSFDYTCYYINCPSNKLTQSTEILMDMVSNPQFLMSGLVPERDVVFEEYRRSLDNPSQYAFFELIDSAFTGGYAHPILGNEKTILNFTKQQLIDFRKKNYNLANSLLVIGGDLSNRKKLEQTIEAFKMPKGEASVFPKFKLKNKNTLNIHEKDVEMYQLSMAFQAPNLNDERAAKEDLAISVLGMGEMSYLSRNLVLKESLANSANSSSMFMNHGGLHFLRFNMPGDNFTKVLNQFKQTLKDIIEVGFTDEEVKKVKNQYIASKIYEKETIESYAFSLGYGYAQTNDIEFDNKFIEKVKRVTKEEALESLLDILSQNSHLVLQVPLGQTKKEIKKQLEDFQKEIKDIVTKKAKKVKKQVKLSKHDPNVQIVNIKKGIKLLYRENKISPTSVLHAYLKSGLSLESLDNNGSHFLISGLLTKGYSGVDFLDIKTEIESNSVSLSGFSGKNAYGLTMQCLSENFDQISDHFFGALLKPDFPEHYFNHELELAKRSLLKQQKDPVRTCFNRVSEIAFSGHSYSFNILGNTDSLNAMTPEKLKAFHQSNLENKEILFTYCGSKSLAEVESLIAEKSQVLHEREVSNEMSKDIQFDLVDLERIIFDREQTHIVTFFQGYKLSQKENLYLKMITSFLSGQSSVLFTDVRDKKGLCYSAQPIHFTSLEAGYWGIYMASGFDKVEKATEAIDDIIKDIKNNAISKTDFNRIKKMIHGQNQLNLQTNEDYASTYSIPELHNMGFDYFHKNNEDITHISYEDFKKNIKKIFSRKTNTLLVGRE